MSLEIFYLNDCAIHFDKELTKNNRTDNNRPCECQDCRNYYQNLRKHINIIEFLSNFGVDYLRPEEVLPYDLLPKVADIFYTAYYCVVGYLDTEVSVKIDDFAITFIRNSNVNVGHEVGDKYFFIEVDVCFPFCLPEERELPPPTFAEKLKTKLKSLISNK